MHKGIIIYLSILVGMALTLGGSYFVIDNLIEPQGLMFEGIIAAALGITLLMIVVVAATIGKSIMLFGEILEQTTKLNNEILKNRPPSLSNLFQNLIPGANMTITDLNTGESQTSPVNPIGKANDIIINAINSMSATAGSKRDKDLNDMTVKELEGKLAIAIKEDNFETAAEINAILKEKRNPSSDSDENKSE